MEDKVSNNIPCGKCSLQFGNRTVLNIHMRLVHQFEAKSMKTEDEIREKTYSTPEYKSTSDKKEYECVMCDFKFPEKGSLKRHIECVHENKRPHRCSICDYSC